MQSSMPRRQSPRIQQEEESTAMMSKGTRTVLRRKENTSQLLHDLLDVERASDFVAIHKIKLRPLIDDICGGVMRGLEWNSMNQLVTHIKALKDEHPALQSTVQNIIATYKDSFLFDYQRFLDLCATDDDLVAENTTLLAARDDNLEQLKKTVSFDVAGWYEKLTSDKIWGPEARDALLDLYKIAPTYIKLLHTHRTKEKHFGRLIGALNRIALQRLQQVAPGISRNAQRYITQGDIAHLNSWHKEKKEVTLITAEELAQIKDLHIHPKTGMICNDTIWEDVKNEPPFTQWDDNARSYQEPANKTRQSTSEGDTPFPLTPAAKALAEDRKTRAQERSQKAKERAEQLQQSNNSYVSGIQEQLKEKELQAKEVEKRAQELELKVKKAEEEKAAAELALARKEKAVENKGNKDKEEDDASSRRSLKRSAKSFGSSSHTFKKRKPFDTKAISPEGPEEDLEKNFSSCTEGKLCSSVVRVDELEDLFTYRDDEGRNWVLSDQRAQSLISSISDKQDFVCDEHTIMLGSLLGVDPVTPVDSLHNLMKFIIYSLSKGTPFHEIKHSFFGRQFFCGAIQAKNFAGISASAPIFIGDDKQETISMADFTAIRATAPSTPAKITTSQRWTTVKLLNMVYGSPLPPRSTRPKKANPSKHTSETAESTPATVEKNPLIPADKTFYWKQHGQNKKEGVSVVEDMLENCEMVHYHSLPKARSEFGLPASEYSTVAEAICQDLRLWLATIIHRTDFQYAFFAMPQRLYYFKIIEGDSSHSFSNPQLFTPINIPTMINIGACANQTSGVLALTTMTFEILEALTKKEWEKLYKNATIKEAFGSSEADAIRLVLESHNGNDDFQWKEVVVNAGEYLLMDPTIPVRFTRPGVYAWINTGYAAIGKDGDGSVEGLSIDHAVLCRLRRQQKPINSEMISINAILRSEHSVVNNPISKALIGNLDWDNDVVKKEVAKVFELAKTDTAKLEAYLDKHANQVACVFAAAYEDIKKKERKGFGSNSFYERKAAHTLELPMVNDESLNVRIGDDVSEGCRWVPTEEERERLEQI